MSMSHRRHPVMSKYLALLLIHVGLVKIPIPKPLPETLTVLATHIVHLVLIEGLDAKVTLFDLVLLLLVCRVDLFFMLQT